MNNLWAIVPAAGLGSRMGSELPKQYHKIAGLPILEHTLRVLLHSSDIFRVIVALHPTEPREGQLPSLIHDRVQIVGGGPNRSDSVLSGLNWLNNEASDDDWVLVHDAARPCLSANTLDKLINEAKRLKTGVILCEPVSDTLKQIDAAGKVVKTVDRNKFMCAQTPQIFPFLALFDAMRACQKRGVIATDEAMAMELSGHSINTISGPANNIKVTFETDLIFAERYLQQELKSTWS